jgi:predicted DNA-binding protein (UPF0251 family)
MSPRPQRIRRVSNPPLISGFRPYGGIAADGTDGSVFLHYEEYEVLRLCDYERMNHHQAAIVMGVSRPTFTRIYAKARAKIAEALVTGKQIIIEGGKVYFDSEWYTCQSCGCYFNQTDRSVKIITCPLCGGGKTESYEAMNEEMADSHIRHTDICVCPGCGFEKPHEPGHPCKEQVCPVCNQHLMRKNNVLAKDL